MHSVYRYSDPPTATTMVGTSGDTSADRALFSQYSTMQGMGNQSHVIDRSPVVASFNMHVAHGNELLRKFDVIESPGPLRPVKAIHAD